MVFDFSPESCRGTYGIRTHGAAAVPSNGLGDYETALHGFQTRMGTSAPGEQTRQRDAAAAMGISQDTFRKYRDWNEPGAGEWPKRQEALTLPYQLAGDMERWLRGRARALRASGRRTCRDLALLLYGSSTAKPAFESGGLGLKIRRDERELVGGDPRSSLSCRADAEMHAICTTECKGIGDRERPSRPLQASDQPPQKTTPLIQQPILSSR